MANLFESKTVLVMMGLLGSLNVLFFTDAGKSAYKSLGNLMLFSNRVKD